MLALLPVKQTASVKADSPAKRKARLGKVLANAKAHGEKLPRGLHLVRTRDLTPAERRFGQTLAPIARKILQKSSRAAA
jgi:hypothetical protein